MDKEQEFRIQAWLDGELSGPEAEEIASRVEVDPRWRARVEELRRTRAALHGAHRAGQAAESAWRVVEARLDQPAPVYGSRLVRFPAALTAVAAVLILSLLVFIPSRDDAGAETEEPNLGNAVYLVETDLENATPIVYIDQPSGWTVVWVAEPESEPDKG